MQHPSCCIASKQSIQNCVAIGSRVMWNSQQVTVSGFTTQHGIMQPLQVLMRQEKFTLNLVLKFSCAKSKSDTQVLTSLQPHGITFYEHWAINCIIVQQARNN